MPSSIHFSRHAGRLAVLALLLAQAWPAQAVTDSKASRFYEDALTRYEKKDLPGAIIQLKNALQIDKNMLAVQVLLGKALLANGEAAAAEVSLTEATRLGVNRAEIVIPMAQAYIAQGKHKLMLEQPQFAAQGLPPAQQLQLLLLRAAAYNDIGDQRNALKSLDEARIVDSRSVDVWLAEVPIRIRARQFTEANAAVARAMAIAPRSAETLYQKGSLLHAQGDLRGAIAAYDEAVAADPKHIEARIVRIGLEIDLKRYAAAAKDLADLQVLSPREPRAAYLRSVVADQEGNTAASAKALREVTSFLDPVPVNFIQYRPQLLMLNGLAHFGLNEREKAKAYLESFQRLQGSSAVTKLLAQLYLSEKNSVRASELLEEYVRVQPGDGQALTLLASAQMAQGRNAKATALMQQALAAKDLPEYHTALGLSLVGSGKVGDGTAQLEAAFKDPTQLQAGVALVGLYLRDGQPTKALAIVERLLKQQPANPAYFNMAGMAQAQLGKLPEARAAFEKALQIDPNLAQVRLNLARLDMAAKDYAGAENRLKALLSSNEKNVDALYEMANLASRRGQASETLRWLEKASDFAGSDELRPGIALVEYHLRNRAPALALEAAKKLSAKAPDNLSVMLVYGRTQLANGNIDGARSTFSGATRFAEFSEERQTEIATLQLAVNNVPGAAYSLEKALSAHPDYLPAQALMTEVELRQGQPAKAEQRARAVLAMAPKLAIGHSLLGDVARNRGQSALAIESYRRAFQIEPTTETMLRLFNQLAGQDGGKAALQLGEQWTKAHPEDIASRRALADSQARLGQFAQARSGYEAIVKQRPDDAPALNNLANVLLRLQDPSAVKVAEQALAKDAGSANALDTLAWALFKSGDPSAVDRSLQLLRDARLREPGNPDIRYHLAAVLAATGRRTEAQEEAQAALQGGRPFESVAEAQNLLKSLK